MSEKTLWKWLDGKMQGCREWDGHRVENCSSKGIPDSVVRVEDKEGRLTSAFIELKDWSGSAKHPLLVEQFNFLRSFGGVVLVKVAKHEVRVCYKELAPLQTCDIEHARATGLKIDTVLTPAHAIADMIIEVSSLWRRGGFP